MTFTLCRQAQVGVVLLSVIAVACQTYAQDRKAELATIAHKSRDGVQDISVSFTFNALQAPKNNPFYRYAADVTIRDKNLLIDSTYGQDPSVLDRTFHREVAFNGARTTTIDFFGNIAKVEDGKSDEIKTNGLGFFDMALFNNDRHTGDGAMDLNLVEFLDSPQTVVRPKMEKVNGVLCNVVDYLFAEKPGMTVWVDPERGCLPMRWEFRSKNDPDQVIIRFETEDVWQVAKGLWLPVSGTKTVNVNGIGQPGTTDMKFEMKVRQTQNHEYLLKVNQFPDESLFDLWKHKPGSMHFWDVNSGQQY